MSRCTHPRDRPDQRYCRACHNAYQRGWKAEQRKLLVKLKSEYGLGKLLHGKQSGATT